MADPVASLASALQDRYRIERQLGQGGMATVYLAQDLRNHRKVALKVLRPDLAALLGAERFLLEIETTANLHHPHILPLFDSGQAGDFLYYAMPFVPGESLRDRLTRENQLPIADAVRIATDVADALDYAHRSGVLHRDIKPENILLHDGRALVADFGVALAMKNAGGTRLTETGLSLGTPQYMSPEQSAAERDLDPRTDVYALGAVTYEMLAGEPPFTGNTTQAIIAKRMMETPRPISVLRKAVPPAVEAAVLRALEKLPADRPASAAAYAAALKETGRTAEVVPLPAKAGLRWRTAALVLSGVALSVFAIRGYLGAKASTATAALPTRVTIPLGQDQLLEQDGLPFDLSADGSEIVYSAASEGKSQLYLRPIGSFQGTPIPGTEGARQPFFSPDGAWIGYVANHRLEKVSRDGGAPLVIAEVPDQWFGAAWGRNGTIYFAEDDTSLYRVSDRGGRPSAIPMVVAAASAADTELSPRPVRYLRWPRLLPGEKTALVATNNGVAAFDLVTGQLRPLIAGTPGATDQARYVPTGHIIYDQEEGHIRVVPFDLAHMRVTGEPLPAFEAFRGPGSGAGQFAVSQNGTLIYVAGGFNRALVLVDRNGRETPVPVPLRGYRFPRFSPDGQRVAVTVDPRPSQIWVADLRSGQLTRITSGMHNLKPVWDPDGQRVVFTTTGGALVWARWQGDDSVHRFMAPGSQPAGPLYPTWWGRDGRLLTQHFNSSYADIVETSFGDSAIRPVLATGSAESQAIMSPDGRWMAYTSNLSGADEIYVRPRSPGGGSTLLSSGGGQDPRWSADGKEVYYRRGSRIMAVPVRTSPTLQAAGAPQLLFAGPYDFSQEDNWDVAPGGRFIMVRADPASRGQFLAVLNWFTELKHAGAAR